MYCCKKLFSEYDFIEIKSVKDIICPILTRLFNFSMSSGIFPNILKKAVIISIHKGGDNELVDNYRPVAILPIISKMFEKLIAKRLNSFFNKVQYFSKNQFRFRSWLGTEPALLSFLCEILKYHMRPIKIIGYQLFF